MRQVTSENIALAQRMAEFYKARGWQPLPMAVNAKKPVIRYADYWEKLLPSDTITRHPTDGLQLMLGRHWRLLAIDLDGPEAPEVFRTWGTLPRTWVTHSGGNGAHLWFRLPALYPHELPRRFLWKGEGPHNGIERLCDHSLIVVPPSIHPTSDQRYRFASKTLSPVRLPLPALAPEWLLRRRPLEAARSDYQPPVVRWPYAGQERLLFEPQDVLDAIGDKSHAAVLLGLRLAKQQYRSGNWISCHVISRQDVHPSGRIATDTGCYWEPGERVISLFELAARLGAFPGWREAVNGLGAFYRAKRK